MAISVVHSASASNGTTSSTTLTFTITSTTAGNSIILVLGWQGASGTTVTAKLGSTSLTANFSEQNTTYTGRCAFFSLDNIASGQTTVTVTFSAASYSAGWVYEVSGLLSTGSYDQHAGATASTGTAASSGNTGTLANASEICFGAINDFSGGAITGPSSPWTNQANQTFYTSSDINFVNGYNIVSATTALAYAGTLTTSNYWCAAIATYQAGSSNQSVAHQ
jgi:hypothetical protein